MHTSHMLSVHSSVDGHVVWFHVFANVFKHLCDVLPDSFRYVSKSSVGHIANSSNVILKISLCVCICVCVHDGEQCMMGEAVAVSRMPCCACVAQRTSLLSQFFPSRFHSFQGSIQLPNLAWHAAFPV